MNRSRSVFTSAFVALAVWLSLVPLGGLVQGNSILVQALPVLLVAAALGCGLAALRVPAALRLPAQLIALAATLGWQAVALAGGDPIGAAESLTAGGVEAIRTGAPPLAPTPGIAWLCLALAALLVVVVEALVTTLDQPAWSIAPLSLVFAIAALIVPEELSWFYALPVVASYLVVLLASASGGRDASGTTPGRFHASRWALVAGAGAASVAIALAVSVVVPLGQKQPWNQAGGDGPIQLADPTVRLDQDLRRPTDVRVLTYRASDDQPHYLRTVALPELSATGARLTPMQLSRFGMDAAYRFPGEELEVSVQMAEVPSEYLPAPFAARSIDAAGSWSYDPATMSIVSSGRDRLTQTLDLSYRVTSVVPNPDESAIEAAGAGGGVDAVNSAVPAGLEPGVAELTASVVEGADTAGAQALAIQRFLRSDAFTYSLDAPASSGSDAISSFLLTDRSGYCIHFAASMITMARIQGIPARMAIGFTPGDALPEGGYEVTAHDAHAWPELFLDGLGWVPFEPTPAFDGPPAYTDPVPQPSAEPTAEPTAEPSAAPESPSPSPEPSAEPEPQDAPQGGGSGPGGWLLGGLAVLLLAAAPAAVRFAQRWARLRPGRRPEQVADGAWREVRCLFADYSLPWPAGSPGPAAAAAAAAGLPDGAAGPLTEIAGQVERSRFARDGAPVQDLNDHVARLRAALRAASTPGRRALAVLLPPSLLRAGPWR